MKQLFYLIALCCLLSSTPAMACVMCDDNNTEQTGRRQRGGRQQMDQDGRSPRKTNDQKVWPLLRTANQAQGPL